MVDRERELRSSSLTGANGVTKSTPKKKPVACHRCHSRKTKCSGQQPCQGCVSAGTADSCSYQLRDRTVKVSERYLQRLLENSERGKQNIASPSPTTPSATVDSNPPETADSPAEISVLNPLIHDRTWFEPYINANLPVYIGEAACTSFTTRFRQALDVSDDGCIPHISRFHYVSDERLASNSNEVRWPSKVKAQLLIKVALAYTGSVYHIILQSATLKRLDQIYESMSGATPMDTCKFFILFAFGEVYSNKTTMGDTQEIPGLTYFIAASRFLQILPERGSLDHVENLILLSLYSHVLNRRHSAFHYIGMAVSVSRTLGLHHNVRQSFNLDPVIRQHRIRLWWTLYYCDRVWSSKLGHPSSIRNGPISVLMPSMDNLNEEQKKDFPDPEYAMAAIRLAKIVGDTIDRVYKRHDDQPFITAVRSILSDVKEWMESLPMAFKLSRSMTPRNISALHLSCNQCVILATRPVLLHILKESLSTSSAPSTPRSAAITPTISALGETCIHTARHTNDLLTQAWIDGTLTTLGYFDAHYLFSATVILAISSILNSSSSDRTAVETSTELLQTMADNGNLSAKDFSEHLKCLRTSIATYWDVVQRNNIHTASGANNLQEFVGVVPFTTTEMALDGTPMQDFLSQIDGGEFDFLNPLLGFEEVSFMDPA